MHAKLVFKKMVHPVKRAATPSATDDKRTVYAAAQPFLVGKSLEIDAVRGGKRRVAKIDRIDSIGRCTLLGNGNRPTGRLRQIRTQLIRRRPLRIIRRRRDNDSERAIRRDTYCSYKRYDEARRQDRNALH